MKETETKPVEIPVPVKPEDGTMLMGGLTFHRSVDSEWPVMQSLYYLTCRTMKSEDAGKYFQGTIDYVNLIATQSSIQAAPATETTPEVLADIVTPDQLDLSEVTYQGLHRKETFTGNLADAYQVALAVRDINALATATAPARARMLTDAKPETTTSTTPAAASAAPIVTVVRKPAPATA